MIKEEEHVNTFMKWFSFIVSIVMVFILIYFGFIMSSGSQMDSDNEKITETYVQEYVKNWDRTYLASVSTPKYKKIVESDAFDKKHNFFVQLGNMTHFYQTNASTYITSYDGASYANSTAQATFENGHAEIRARLKPIEDKWLIDYIEVLIKAEISHEGDTYF